MNKIIEDRRSWRLSRLSAAVSILFNGELDSNEIDESYLHFERHDGPRVLTFRGV
jgi:hypothetical protein